MTAEEIVLGGYAAFASGDMESLASIYHPECKITCNGKPRFFRNIYRFQRICGRYTLQIE